VGNYHTQLQRLIDCVLPTTHVSAGPNQMLRADYNMQSTGFPPKEANYRQGSDRICHAVKQSNKSRSHRRDFLILRRWIGNRSIRLTVGRNPVAVRNSRIGLFLQNSNRGESDARRNARKCVGYVLARARGPLKKRTPLNFDRETTLSASRSSDGNLAALGSSTATLEWRVFRKKKEQAGRQAKDESRNRVPSAKSPFRSLARTQKN
jgi:hypothetical protein